MCLSAITWAGFDNFYFLFSYEDSRDDFAIPHDLRILEEVFECSDGGYVAENAYWKGYDIVEIAEGLDRSERDRLAERIANLRTVYAELSQIYQSSKAGSEIPLA
jgi:tRNA(Arg) A34 adenosine deaminase TadA